MAVLDEHEGGYSDHELDPGGKTYRGISRVYWPNWPGWEIIDTESGGLEDESTLRRLDRLVQEFYRGEFWTRFQGDKVADLSQEVATELLECSVNLGVHRCVEFLQEALNVLNLNQRAYMDLVVDGLLGPVTLDRLRLYLDTRPPSRKKAEWRLLKVMNVQQGAHYFNQMKLHPDKEEFRGWFDRA